MSEHDDSPLDDGRYDAFVVWCDARDDGTIAFDLTITSGAHRGDVLTVTARDEVLRGRDVIDAVGLPCMLVVVDGRPAIEW